MGDVRQESVSERKRVAAQQQLVILFNPKPKTLKPLPSILFLFAPASSPTLRSTGATCQLARFPRGRVKGRKSLPNCSAQSSAQLRLVPGSLPIRLSQLGTVNRRSIPKRAHIDLWPEFGGAYRAGGSPLGRAHNKANDVSRKGSRNHWHQ